MAEAQTLKTGFGSQADAEVSCKILWTIPDCEEDMRSGL